MYNVLKESINEKSKILDLGTGGGEKLIKNFPNCEYILGTDFSLEMIKTAECNLAKSGRNNIYFKQMDNLNMDTPNDYFDVVCARHTCIDAKGIYRTLKQGGKLILRGVDKLDCWQLKMMFKKGQAFNDNIPISLIDYENIINAGFKKVELIPIHIKEYYETKEDLLALLLKTPILQNFSEISENDLEEVVIDEEIFKKYIEEFTCEKGILLIRRYYGIVAYK